MDPDLRASLVAAMMRILPPGDGFDAEEAGVVNYFDGAWKRMPEAERGRLVEGLETIDVLACGEFDSSFALCQASQQDEVLRRLEGIPHRIPRLFFHQLINICLAGFLCHPRHGGNRDRLGWDFMGFRPRPESSYKGASE